MRSMEKYGREGESRQLRTVDVPKLRSHVFNVEAIILYF